MIWSTAVMNSTAAKLTIKHRSTGVDAEQQARSVDELARYEALVFGFHKEENGTHQKRETHEQEAPQFSL
jgi:hypothetical protein